MKKMWLFVSMLYVAGCSTQKDSAPKVVQSPRLASTPIAVTTPTPAAQVPSPASSLANPEAFVAKRFEKQQMIVLRELGKLQKSKPEQDLQLAWQKKDFRFLGVRGYSTEVLGVAGGISNPVVAAYGVKAIEGTGDVRFSSEQANLQKLAAEYSTRYNRLLIQKLKG